MTERNKINFIMMKNIIFLLLMILFWNKSDVHSNSFGFHNNLNKYLVNSDSNEYNPTLFRFRLIAPRVSYEFPIGSNLTILSTAGLGLFYIDTWTQLRLGLIDVFLDANATSAYYIRRKNSLQLYPFTELELRKYYSLKKRKLENKNVKFYSSSFLGLYFGYSTYGNVKYGPVWGLNRSFGDNFYFYFNLGAMGAFNYILNKHGIVPYLRIGIGLNIEKPYK